MVASRRSRDGAAQALMIAGQRRAPLVPRFRAWLPFTLGAVACTRGFPGRSRIREPRGPRRAGGATRVRLAQRRAAMVTIPHGSRRALRQRGGVAVEFAWRAAEPSAG